VQVLARRLPADPTAYLSHGASEPDGVKRAANDRAEMPTRAEHRQVDTNHAGADHRHRPEQHQSVQTTQFRVDCGRCARRPVRRGGKRPQLSCSPGEGDPLRRVDPPDVFDTRRYGFGQAVVVDAGRRLVLSGQVAVHVHDQTVGRTLREQLGQCVQTGLLSSRPKPCSSSSDRRPIRMPQDGHRLERTRACRQL
jgi:hypothetical protein